MDIRLMAPEDYPQVYALWAATKGMGLNPADDSREGLERYLRRNPATCFAAEEGGRIAGAILAGHDGRRGYIYHVAVAESSRRQGIGRELVRRAMEALQLQGIQKAALVVFASNQEGNAFWEKLGFTVREDLCYRNRSLQE